MTDTSTTTKGSIEPLSSVKDVEQVIDTIIRRYNNEGSDGVANMKVELMSVDNSSNSSSSNGQNSIPYYFGFSIKNATATAADAATTTTTTGLCTFYIAYSTWDGRMLYVDQLTLPSLESQVVSSHVEQQEMSSENNNNNNNTVGMRIEVFHLLAKIAVALNCARLCWAQPDDPTDSMTVKSSSSSSTSVVTVQPEFCQEWLFLKWNRTAMASFVGTPSSNDNKIVSPKGLLDRSVVTETIQRCLEEGQSTETDSNNTNGVTLRLATGEKDMKTIGGLVMGLAIYEKEPDAVNVTPQDYYRDSDMSKEPLFYCLLADFNVKNSSADGQSSSSIVATGGMGFVFFGYEYGQGPFMYLEDLYIEEKYRGTAGGKLMMKELARIALKLGCVKLSWSALDWNTPALNFYKKIGATIEEDKKLSRFCGQSLIDFANS